jgi:hypothetical protein
MIKPASAGILKRQLPQLIRQTSELKMGSVQNIANLRHACRFIQRLNEATATRSSSGMFPSRLCDGPFQNGYIPHMYNSFRALRYATVPGLELIHARARADNSALACA